MAEVLQTDVAVIGGGPAGIAAAVAARRQGVERVTILEREGSAGGVPRHCGHPPFGMREFGLVLSGPAYARKLVELAERSGVDVRTRHSVTRLGPEGRLAVATPDGPVEVVARRVVIATGARETPRSARLVGGDRPGGVITTGALQAFVYLKGLKPFRRPLIVGTELVSFSAVLTALRHGMRPVGMVEEGARPTARRPFDLFPRMFGIPIHWRSRVVDIHGDGGRVDAVTLMKDDGGTTTVVCDGVLFTGRFVPEASLVRGGDLVLDDGSEGPEIDQYGRCSDPAYFAAGNVLRPIETAGWSFREGLRIGKLVARDLVRPLPVRAPSPRFDIGGGLKLVVPRRLVLPLDGAALPHLQLRVQKETTGDLVIEADRRPIWHRRVSVLPERRLLIPLSDLNIPEATQTLSVGIGR